MLEFSQNPEMATLAAKHKTTVEECIVRLLSRAENSRGLKTVDVESRIVLAVEKYILRDDEKAGHNEISEFIDSLRADDLCLIIACEKGDETAWGDIVLNFDSSVKSAAYKFAKNKEDAEDLASSIWAELHGLKLDAEGKTKGKLSYYSGKGSLAGWLRAVTNQLAIDQFRKMKRLVQTEDDREFENLAQDSAEKADNKIVVSASENPEEIFSDSEAQKDIVDALHKAIAGLKDEDRLIMKLYYFEGLKLKDISETFGFHEATASRKLVRVQTEIRKSVEKVLSEKHGWNQNEVKKYLTESAEKLGMNLETLFALLIVFWIVQESVGGFVL
ncbi:MAG: sigma-70 family RNA polymerase sigma factor [Pyrinomonadaceae bacterium]|nr:sigma-70 family RNA polymerase sigma factor [Pyrinomonadaceae bacterium]